MQAEDSDSDSSGDELTTYTNRDGTQSSATAAELKLAAALSKDPWGRFGGRAGKMARIRAQEAETLAAMQVPPLHSAIHLISHDLGFLGPFWGQRRQRGPGLCSWGGDFEAM